MIDEIQLGTTLVDVTPTPEPATAALVVTGLAVSGAAFCRRRRSVAR